MRYILLSLIALCNIAIAGVTIDGTRIIFPSEAKSINVQLRNAFDQPALVQTWIDHGNPLEIPSADEIPFILNPSLTRVEPQKGQIIRIIPTDLSTLPKDRESLYWFNLLDIPPENQALLDVDKVKFNVRTRIKLFYRPTNLNIQPQQAYKLLKFKDLNEKQMEVDNPTPYFITLIQVQNKSKTESYLDNSIILKPFDKTTIHLVNKVKNPDISYSVMNDLGNLQDFNTQYSNQK